jgi:hypothetical protein
MTTNTNELIRLFQEAAVAFGEAFEEGDSIRANLAYDECESTQNTLRQRGASAIASLTKLLDSDDPWVRYAAAACVLDRHPTRSVAILEELKKAPKAVGIAAYTTLKNWDMSCRKKGGFTNRDG